MKHLKLLPYLFLFIQIVYSEPKTFSFSLNDHKLSIFSFSQDSILTLNEAFKRSKVKPLIVTNGGIFNPDYKTTGLLISNDSIITPLNKQKGKGNFYFKPNGVFFIENNKPFIHITNEYIRRSPKPSIAIQSGPILVYNNLINSKLNPKSQSKYTRNAIGIDSNENIHLVYFAETCTLYEMATYLKDFLNCKSALYLDGAISGIITENIKINENQPFASIIVVK